MNDDRLAILFATFMPSKKEEGQMTFKAYNPSGEEQGVISRLKKRIDELKNARLAVLNAEEGKSIEGIWRDCEKMYIPHRYFSTALKDWQSKNSQPNPFSKVMTALSVIIANNPEVVLRAANEEFEPKTNLLKALYDRSWKVGLSKNQLALFVLNLAQKGFAMGRTYHKKITRGISDIVFIDPVTGDQTYEEKEVDVFNEVYFENMNPWNSWVDDMAIPNDPLSVRDWCWRHVFSFETFRTQFAKFKNVEAVHPGGNTEEDNSGYSTNINKEFTTKDLVEVWYYENQERDEFHIMADDVLLTKVKSPLPYMHKRISCTFTQWNPRSATNIYGIGIIEAIKEDQETIDKIRNMSIDELVLSIYQMFFHGPSVNFSEGKLRVEPGRLVQVSNPSDVKPVQFSPPSQQTVQWLELMEKSMDEGSGITKSLSGEFIGKTAFEVQQNRDAGLRKLKIPISNIEYALTLEARNHIDLLQQVLSMPVDIKKIVGRKTYDDFFNDYLENPDLYQVVGESLMKRREVRLNLENDQEKGFMESKTTNSFILTPDLVRWEGEVEIQPQSTLVKTVEIERQQTLDLFNVLAQLPTTALAKAEKRLLKVWGEDPDNWMPTDEEMMAKQQISAMEDAMAQEQEAMGVEGAMGQDPVVADGPEPAIPRNETKIPEGELAQKLTLTPQG